MTVRGLVTPGMPKPSKHPLTVENLKRLENQFANEDKRKRDLARRTIPERTEADGRSSSKHSSYGSQVIAFKQSLNRTSRARKSAEAQANTKRRSEQWFSRPDREPLRRNPEGRSRNTSFQATPNVVRIDYDDDEDYRINYEDYDEVEEDEDDTAGQAGLEESEDESSRVDSDDRVVPPPRKDDAVSSDGTPLTRSSSPASSEDESDDDDDDDDGDGESEEDEDDGQVDEQNGEDARTDVDPAVLNALTATEERYESRPATRTSARSASALKAGSVSSIPTAPASRASLGGSHTPVATPRASSVASSAPSYVLNKHEYRLQKMRDKMEKERARAGSRAAESSLALSSRHSFSDLSMRERATTTATPDRGRGSVIRNWSRWSRYSEAGYSISEASVDRRRKKKSNKPQGKNSADTTNARRQERKASLVSSAAAQLSRASSRARSGLTGVLQIWRIKSEPDVRRAKRQPDGVTSRAGSRATTRRGTEGGTSRNISRSAASLKRVRPKSESNLKKSRELSGKASKGNGKSTSTKHSGAERPPLPIRPRTRNKGGKTDEMDNLNELSNRKKKIPKKKERPARATAGTALSNASSTWTARVRSRSRAMESRSLINPSALSTRTSIKSGGSQSRSNLSSAATFTSGKPQNPLLTSESGFFSEHGRASTQGSLRAPETPFSAVSGRTTGLRSTVTVYSSCPSRPISSRRSSAGNASDEELSSHSDGESTAIGPETSPPRSAPTSPAAPADPPSPDPAQAPESAESGSEAGSERLALPPITPRPDAYISPYTSTVREMKRASDLKKKKKEQVKLPKIARVNHPMPNLELATKDTGMARLVRLSKPKESKAIWMTSFWPIVWGNQEMMCPIPRAALSANATDRLHVLATPKKNFQPEHPRGEFHHSFGRSSVIWKVSPQALNVEASARVAQLSQPKKPPPEFEEDREATLFGCGRSSPIWHVSEAAKTAEERERTLQLAQPKKTHSLYQPERCVAWPVSAGARRAVASARVEHLARPKSRNDGLLRDPMWRVSSASRRVVASARVHELARPKQLAEGYQPCRDTEWAVPRGALRGAPSERVQVLSKPIIRETMDHVQFNPDAFTVSEAAKKAAISQRIVELAQPLSRGHK